MIGSILSLNKDKLKGVLIGFNLFLLLTSILGLSMNLRYERFTGEFTVAETYDITLGEMEDINQKKVPQYTLNTGTFSEACIANVSITSPLPSAGNIEGLTFCRGEKIYLGDWMIELKEVHPSRAIVAKTEMKDVPIEFVWYAALLLAIFTLIIFAVLKENKPELSEKEFRRIIRSEVQTMKAKEELPLVEKNFPELKK